MSPVGWLVVNWKGSGRKQSWPIPSTILAFAMAKSGYYFVICHSSFHGTSLTFAIAHFYSVICHSSFHGTSLTFAIAYFRVLVWHLPQPISRFYHGICHGSFRVLSWHSPWPIQGTILSLSMAHSGYYPGICHSSFRVLSWNLPCPILGTTCCLQWLYESTILAFDTVHSR